MRANSSHEIAVVLNHLQLAAVFTRWSLCGSTKSVVRARFITFDSTLSRPRERLSVSDGVVAAQELEWMLANIVQSTRNPGLWSDGLNPLQNAQSHPIVGVT
jgi:hypothetical protein